MYCSPKYEDLNHLTFLQGAWKPSLNISTVLTSIQLLMAEPNPDDPLMADIVSHSFTFTYSIQTKTSTYSLSYHYMFATFGCWNDWKYNDYAKTNFEQPGMFSVFCYLYMVFIALHQCWHCSFIKHIVFKNVHYNVLAILVAFQTYGIIKKNTPHCD